VKTNVVTMAPRARSVGPVRAVRTVEAFGLSIDQLDSYQGRKKIASLLRTWHVRQPRQEHTWVAFARGLTIGSDTVSKIASETTVAPRLHTILQCMKGLGFAFVRFE
jgi:hypothetical protein